MNELKRDMARIQTLVGDAFNQTGGLVALSDGGQMAPEKLQRDPGADHGSLRTLHPGAAPPVRDLFARCRRLSAQGGRPSNPCSRIRGTVRIWLAPHRTQHIAAPLPLSGPGLAQRYPRPPARRL